MGTMCKHPQRLAEKSMFRGQQKIIPRVRGWGPQHTHRRAHRRRPISNATDLFCSDRSRLRVAYSHHKRLFRSESPLSLTLYGSTTISWGYSMGLFDHMRIVHPVPGVSMTQ